MKNVLILHGTLNNSQDNWFSWLKDQLEKLNFRVWVPDLPRADKPNLQRYKDFFGLRYEKIVPRPQKTLPFAKAKRSEFLLPKWEFNEETVLVGHSSGAVAILGILEALPRDVIIEKAILVAGFKDDLDWEPTRELFIKPLNYEKIRKQAKKFILIHSDDDPYVSLEHGEFLKEKLRGELVVLSGQKHFSIDSAGEKYREFPELLKYIDE